MRSFTYTARPKESPAPRLTSVAGVPRSPIDACRAGLWLAHPVRAAVRTMAERQRVRRIGSPPWRGLVPRMHRRITRAAEVQSPAGIEVAHAQAAQGEACAPVARSR